VCGVVVLFSKREQRVLRSRAITSRAFRWYLNVCQTLGLMRLDLSALDALNDQAPMVIAPNHPSLIDVVLVMSRLHNCSCVAKSSLMLHPVLGIGARANNYVSNAAITPMLKDAISQLDAGAHVLIFPEGTRTRLEGRTTINPLSGSACIVAKRAQVKVQLVYIHTNSAFLGANWSMLKIPVFPIIYTARLGEQLSNNEDLAGCLITMQQAFENNLSPVQV
jgi:1-acyl-sn-glycerol-3-phosphate acyltransferase